MKITIVSILFAVFLIIGAFNLPRFTTDSDEKTTGLNNVSIVDNKQVIEITAKGGYQPKRSMAKAGIPTLIRFRTSGTFDCSSSVRIPSLNVSQYLPQTGIVDIDIGISKTGILKGSCGMGMYPFEIDFQG